MTLLALSVVLEHRGALAFRACSFHTLCNPLSPQSSVRVPCGLSTPSTTAFKTASFDHCVPKIFASSQQASIIRLHSTSSAATETTSAPGSLLSSALDVPGSLPKLIFVTGKGGVGKTSTSASLALLIKARTEGKNVLLCSTDPAHSVHDCLAIPKPSSPTVEPYVALASQSTSRLYVSELDVRSSPLNSLTKDNLRSALDADEIASALGVSPQVMETFGVRAILDDVKSILTDSEDGADDGGAIFPPGSDELLCVLDLVSSRTDAGESYDYIVVDTAPSGHTVRMLNGPRFIDTALGKLLKFKSTVGDVMSRLAAFTGQAGEGGGGKKLDIDKALELIDTTQTKIANFQDAVDSGGAQFVVVGVPTKLSFEETRRVVADLNEMKSGPGPAVGSVVVNQILPEELLEDATKRSAFAKRRARSHAAKIEELEPIVAPAKVHKVPYVDTEIVGGPGLSYLWDLHLSGADLEDLFEPPAAEEGKPPRVVVFGGKGGVGKTTCSAASAVRMMKLGHKVAVVSTDPAHSLGDAFGVPLSGSGVDLTPTVYDNLGGGTLTGYEIDTRGAVDEFKTLLTGLSTPKAVADAGVSVGDLASILETLPPGADEVIALAKVVDLLKKGGYTRIVLDTAPTGHTLRMLTFPRFVDGLIEKVIKVAERVKSTAMMLNNNIKEEDVENAKMKLLGFQLKMFELDELFADPDSCEFVIVTIPTDMAVKETGRLFEELKDGEVKVKVNHVLVNQVAGEKGEDDGEAFVKNVVRGQQSVVGKFEEFAQTQGIELCEVGLCDEEPKSEFGLMTFWDAFTKEKKMK